MFLKYNLFVLISSFGLASSIFVVWTKNPIFSVLFLIFSFVNVSCLLFLFDFEFLPIAFLVVYVGAVAVLFLFVIMMLNIKLAELVNSYYHIVPVGLFFVFIMIYQLAFVFQFEFQLVENLDKYSVLFLSDFSNGSTNMLNYYNLNYSFSNLKLIGIVLFSNYLYHFLLAGLVLLLAMIGAIVLTLQKQFVTKTQNIYQQILKDYSVALTFSI